MKGLLTKDIRLLKNQRYYLLLIMVLNIAFLVMEQEMSFIVGYTAAIFSILTINTISYDEIDNGYRYLFTLPVSRRGYVLEKYMFGLFMIVLVVIVSAVFVGAAPVVKPAVYQKTEWEILLPVSLSVSALIQAVAIPIQLKFGAEKSRIALALVVPCVMFGTFGIRAVIETLKIDLSGVRYWGSQLSGGMITGLGSIGAVVLLAVSCMISIGVMERKQF